MTPPTTEPAPRPSLWLLAAPFGLLASVFHFCCNPTFQSGNEHWAGTTAGPAWRPHHANGTAVRALTDTSASLHGVPCVRHGLASKRWSNNRQTPPLCTRRASEPWRRRRLRRRRGWAGTVARSRWPMAWSSMCSTRPRARRPTASTRVRCCAPPALPLARQLVPHHHHHQPTNHLARQSGRPSHRHRVCWPPGCCAVDVAQ